LLKQEIGKHRTTQLLPNKLLSTLLETEPDAM